MGAFLLVAATRESNNVLNAGEVRAHKVVLLDENGKQVYYVQGIKNGYDNNGQISKFLWSN